MYICEGDNKLLVDLKKESSLNAIYSSVKKKGELNLCEIEMLAESIVQDFEGNHYISEFVFSFVQSEAQNSKITVGMEEDFVQDNIFFQKMEVYK